MRKGLKSHLASEEVRVRAHGQVVGLLKGVANVERGASLEVTSVQTLVLELSRDAKGEGGDSKDLGELHCDGLVSERCRWIQRVYCEA